MTSLVWQVNADPVIGRHEVAWPGRRRHRSLPGEDRHLRIGPASRHRCTSESGPQDLKWSHRTRGCTTITASVTSRPFDADPTTPQRRSALQPVHRRSGHRRDPPCWRSEPALEPAVCLVEVVRDLGGVRSPPVDGGLAVTGTPSGGWTRCSGTSPGVQGSMSSGSSST